MHSHHNFRSDAELIEAHLAGDIAAWEALLTRYEKFIYRLILRARPSQDDVEDLFQNVCVKFYSHLDDLRDVNRLAGWLGAVVSQEIIRWSRRVAAMPPSVSLDSQTVAELPRTDPLPEDIVIAEERLRFVRQALNESGEPCNRLLSLLYRPDPASYAEIAEQMGIPSGSIGPRRARCLERLKNLLAKAGY